MSYEVKNVQSGYVDGTGKFHPARRNTGVQAGYYDAKGFHPLRRSRDYDPDVAGDPYGARTDATGLKHSRYSKFKRAHKFSHGAAVNPRRKGKGQSIGSIIPVKWAEAKVKRVGKQIQVMLFGGKKNPGSGIGVGDRVRHSTQYLSMLRPSVRRAEERGRYTVTMVEPHSEMARMVDDHGYEWRTPLSWLVPAGR
jgi:hypothetical protein